MLLGGSREGLEENGLGLGCGLVEGSCWYEGGDLACWEDGRVLRLLDQHWL